MNGRWPLKILKICEKFYNTKEISFEDFSNLMNLDKVEAEDLHAFARDLAVKTLTERFTLGA